MELVFKNNNNIVTTSLLVAEKFGKNHRDVLESIRELLSTAENSALLNWFDESEYVASNGKRNPMYIMNRDGFSLLVMGFTGKKALDFKLEYIDAFNKMEQTLSRPRTHKEVLMSELALLEENERLQIENSKMKTRSDFVNIVFDSDKLLTGSKVCKLLNLPYGNQTLYKKLREKGIFFKNGNEPKQSYVDRGYFRMKEIVVNDIIKTQTLFTQKGLGFIAKTLEVVVEPIKQVKTI